MTEGLQALGAEILAEAEQIAQEQVQTAERRAAAIREEAGRAREALIAEAVAGARRRVEQDRLHTTATAEAMARQRLLAAREELINRVLAGARDQLRDGLSPQVRADDIAASVLEAAQALAGGDLTVQASVQDQATLNALLPRLERDLATRGATATLRPGPPAAILGGAVISRDQGRVIIDNSFDARLEQQTWALRNRIWQTLQGQTF